MKQSHKKALTFVVRWGIAAVGVWWVLSKISWRDQALVILDPATNVPAFATLAAPADESDPVFHVLDPRTRGKLAIDVPHDRVLNERDRGSVVVDGKKQTLLGLDLTVSGKTKKVNRLLVADDQVPPRGRWVTPDHAPGYVLDVPHPRVQIGVHRMLATANVRFILCALVVFPLTFLLTSYRWHELLHAIEIELSLARTFVLNMVGSFYNTFMPGSTGGDLLKAYYVAKQTHHRTRGVISVLIDRAMGLIALVMLGGTMASVAAFHDHVPKTGRVAAVSGLILLACASGTLVFYVPLLRRLSGFDFIAAKLPMQKQVQSAIHTMELYGKRPGLMLWALLLSFPVHMTVIAAAMFCGQGFHLPIPLFLYWTAVPVIVLSGSIPGPPQGAGVMEYFAVLMLGPQGVTVAQAFALTMSIRLVQIAWNLTGGYFVLRGGYHAPTAAEQTVVGNEDVDKDLEAPTPVPAA